MSLNSTLASSLRWSSSATTVAEADALLAKLWASSDARRLLLANSATGLQTIEPIAVRTGVMNLAVVANGAERAALLSNTDCAGGDRRGACRSCIKLWKR